ncbi:MAG TPA: O-antigen ligase family protein [Blastocatellia bacterium]|nr:O-antigen ligase family protein [Blastocatellia bacterium]HMV85236.1 O-antigen ligase family protein [Blastocatellia bacterium]HMX26531.1 O-antigen ligase family protein [Blastocatellia bacterium]HMY71811.1 O-antigen ligase family protein [Blastocatellia bacterium]HMZ19498.1 O-antigen ligase family protein [Blastocatellia bacterium]
MPNSSKLESFIFADLLATAVFAVLAYGTVEPWSLALFELNALLVAVLLAVRFVFQPEAGWGDWRMALPLVAWLAFGAAQMAFSLTLDKQATKEASVKLLALTIYFLAALATLRRSERRKKALIVLTIFGFAVSLFAILQRLTYNGKMYWVRPVSAYIAPFGPYGNYNHFAGMVELLLPLPLAYLLFSKINLEQRLLWLFSVVMMSLALVLSLSRGGLLALGIELAVLMPAARWDRLQSVRAGEQARAFSTVGNGLILGGALTAVALLALWIGYEPLSKRFGTVRQGAGEYSLVTRTEYWRGAWQMFLDHPVAGVGLGAFPTAYPAYGRSSVRNERLEQAHNDYLQLLADTGLIGGLIGLWFLIELLRRARKQLGALRHLRSADRAMLLGGYVAALGIGVHSFLDFNLQIAANALLFLLVVALAATIDFKPDE